jgi:hypothetical protein
LSVSSANPKITIENSCIGGINQLRCSIILSKMRILALCSTNYAEEKK